MQDRVESYHSELAEHTSDAIGNIPVIQSFTRVQAELQQLRLVPINHLLSIARHLLKRKRSDDWVPECGI